MDDAVTPIRPFGDTRQQRKETLLAIARQLNETGTVDSQGWRRALSDAVANACGITEGGKYVYGYMTTLGSDGLKEVRIACIGEAANDMYYGEAQGRRGHKTRAESLQEHEWTPKFQKAIAMIKAEKSPMTKTAIARFAMGETNFGTVYNFLRTYSTEKLEAIGYPKPGEYTPDDSPAPPVEKKPKRNEGDGNESRASVDVSDDITYDDASRLARHDMAFEEKLATLEPEARTRQNLAAAMGKPMYVIDGYAYANRRFAERLIDGLDVFKPKFLK